MKLPLKIRLADIYRVAPTKPKGYLETVLAAGRIEGDALIITHASYLSLCAHYRQAGDAVAVAAKPIADLLKLNNCAGCESRGARLNGGAKLLKPL